MKIFRTIAVLAAVFTMTAALQAENYRILYVNTDSVRIGGRMLSAGDIFKETEDIQWTEDLQSIKVIGTDSRQISVCAGAPVKQNGDITGCFKKTGASQAERSGGTLVFRQEEIPFF